MVQVNGFNQAEAIKLGLTNDDLLFLRWFIVYKDISADKRY